MLNITVQHPRRFLRAPPPVPGSAATTFQIDQETGGILAAGVPYIATGWFAGGYTGEFAGYPLTVSGPFVTNAGTNLCASHLAGWENRPVLPGQLQDAQCASDATNLDQTLSQISVASEWGRLGLHFVRSGLNFANTSEAEAYVNNAPDHLTLN